MVCFPGEGPTDKSAEIWINKEKKIDMTDAVSPNFKK